MHRECRERFPVPWGSNPGMLYGTCVTLVTRCTPGSLASSFLWSRWRGKRSWHSRRMRNMQFYVSDKRPMALSMKICLDFFIHSHFGPVYLRDPYVLETCGRSTVHKLKTILAMFFSRLLMVCNTFCMIWWYHVTHRCHIGPDKGMSPVQHQTMIRTNAGSLLIWPLGPNFNEICIKIRNFSFKCIKKYQLCCIHFSVLKTPSW